MTDAALLLDDAARRLHPWTLLQRFVTSLPAFAFAVLPLLSTGANFGSWLFIGVSAIYGFIALPLIVLQYHLFRYWVLPDELVIRSGVFTQQKRNIPMDRVQNVVVQQNLLARVTGTAKVKIETAGSSATEGVLEYVSLAEAKRVRTTIRRFQKAQKTPVPETEGAGVPLEASADTGAEERDDVLLRLSPGEVVLAGALRISLVYFAVIFFPLQYIDFSSDDLLAWLEGGFFRPFLAFALNSPWLLVTALSLAAIGLAWLTSIVVTLNRFWDFRLSRSDDKLHTRSGLLTLSLGTIPLKKVQAAVLVANPLMRRFDYWRLEVQTTGHDQQQGRRVAVPFARLARVLGVVPHVHPFSLPSQFTPVSRLTIRRGFVRYSFLFLLSVGGTALVWQPAVWALVLWPAMWGLAVLRWRNLGYAVDGNRLFVRRGLWRHTIWTAPLEKSQVFYTYASLFQRRLGLASVYADTAGDATASALIIDLPQAEADALLQHLYTRFQAHFAGRERIATETEGGDVEEAGAGGREEGTTEVGEPDM